MKIRVLFIGLLLIVLICGFFIPFNFYPPGDKRMVIDRTYEVYIAPRCFDKATVTNNLAETTWEKVKKMGYKAESSCTLERMSPVKQTLWQKLKEWVGIVPSSWPW